MYQKSVNETKQNSTMVMGFHYFHYTILLQLLNSVIKMDYCYFIKKSVSTAQFHYGNWIPLNSIIVMESCYFHDESVDGGHVIYLPCYTAFI